MREAMATAVVGDDVFQEDPTIRELEEEVAALTGFESALYVPSGTMANQIAINLHTRPGDSVLIEAESHVFIYEAGAGPALSGVQFDCASTDDFTRWTAAASSLVREDNLHSATTSLIVVENTHNRHGGRVFPLEGLDRIRDFRHSRRGVALHCDGARIWNASVATGMPVSNLLRGFDSASVCFSKGLGAPVGSALCGPREWINRARKIRKRWGGGMRQGGIVAAGALFALRHNRERLAEDHQRAAMLAGLFRELRATRPDKVLGAKTPDPQTNMVYVQVPQERDRSVVDALGKSGVLVLPTGNGWIRAVTHLDVPAPAMGTVLEAFASCLLA
jgi:threonine aldolase